MERRRRPPLVSGAGDTKVQGRNLAVSYAVAGSSGPMTYHAAANTTSYITAPGSGDHTADLDVFAYEFTTASWFFIDAVDVMAAGGHGGDRRLRGFDHRRHPHHPE